ncbi:hypothetical protein [Gracilibacillus lacisalsi]|uniref:hypothetical protein n=1 Tax=Gracilibacillus lacisalsi TaxID=393087 RepID=UPI0003674CC1|nr:hypothetical protein [Gracilibacillus lacisalsi]
MLQVIVFLLVSFLLVYLEMRRLRKGKQTKDLLCFMIGMSVAIVLISLHFLDIQLPYILDMLRVTTKPLSNSLQKWLEGFLQP